MGDPSGFLDIQRVPMPERDPRERIRDHKEIFGVLPDEQLKAQGARCMDCGVPFCHDGCPLGNLIPDWNDLIYRDRWREASARLHATNNFPEFTGLICPAPCESACVLAIESLEQAVMIKQIEYAIVHHAWEQGWIQPVRPAQRSGRRVAVVGSGPAGLAVAQQLNHAGHTVVVYERDEGPGGLLRFGVPDAKLEKWIIDRRVAVLEAEGIEFRYGVDVGRDLPVDRLRAEHDAVIVATGSRVPRDADVPGRDLAGVEFAMDYLYQRNRAVAAMEGREHRQTPPGRVISAEGKRVVVVGGGDTGMDCISNALREGAVEQLGLDLDRRGNVKAPVYGTKIEGVFACGDARTGQSLVVTAIAEGRRCARVVDQYLGGSGEVRRVPAEAMFAYEDGDPHSLRHQAEIARTVTVGDAFWTGPRDER